MVKRSEWYPLGERTVFSDRTLYAKWDGKPKRTPLKGEWYLSGAIVEAYQARNDFVVDKFHIAKVYRTQAVTILVPIEEV